MYPSGFVSTLRKTRFASLGVSSESDPRDEASLRVFPSWGIHDGEELEDRPRPFVPAWRAVAGVFTLLLPLVEEDRPRPFVPAWRAVAGVFTLLLPLVAVLRLFVVFKKLVSPVKSIERKFKFLR